MQFLKQSNSYTLIKWNDIFYIDNKLTTINLTALQASEVLLSKDFDAMCWLYF